MRFSTGRIQTLQMDPLGCFQAFIACPEKAIPAPGQYIMAQASEDRQAVLAAPIFASEIQAGGFWTAPSIPDAWLPGATLHLRGPAGRGFQLPSQVRRLAMAAIGDTAARLMPLARQAQVQKADVALFTDAALPQLPAWLEFGPLQALAEALNWADFLAIDIPLHMLDQLSKILGEETGKPRLPYPAQVLIWAPMPCGGIGMCSACAVITPSGWKLACEDGPVFDLRELWS